VGAGGTALLFVALDVDGDAVGGAVSEFAIRGETIRLGQLLKAAGVAGSGADAKELLLAGSVRVNGEPEARRGRQLRRGDVVEVDGERVQIR